MYALNLGENNGFVVMSASLVERPILVYSHEGSFDFENIGDYCGVSDWALTKYLKINGLLEVGIFRWTIGKTTYSYRNCHAWVADGFETINRTLVFNTGRSLTVPITKHVHLNWGWGDLFDGWYDYENWDDINGNNIADVDYIYKQNMIYNIIPK